MHGIIHTVALRKIYSAAAGDVVALDGLDLDVFPGEFFGLLGPNGAGKTTTIGILTTRVLPTGGVAQIGGVDVQRDPAGVKQRIGVVPQRPNPDRSLSVRENLLFHAAYFCIPRGVASERADSLLGRLGLADRRDAKIDHLSGGQQQRLMIARALMHAPQVLFLDEPTVGLDPQARLAFWDILRELHEEGRTIVMTTHYMEEADQLCQRIAIVDHGKLLAIDTPAKLKARAPGGTMIELRLNGPAEPIVADAKALPGVQRAEAVDSTLRVYAEQTSDVISGVLKVIDHAALVVQDIHLSPPSLETLFISLTGRRLE